MDAIGYSTSLLTLTIIGVVALLLLGGCAQNEPYHKKNPPWTTDDCGGTRADEGQAYYQEHDNYDLAFVEFSDRDVIRHSLVQKIVRAYEKYLNRTGTPQGGKG